jgi:hypothetical protein
MKGEGDGERGEDGEKNLKKYWWIISAWVHPKSMMHNLSKSCNLSV